MKESVSNKRFMYKNIFNTFYRPEKKIKKSFLLKMFFVLLSISIISLVIHMNFHMNSITKELSNIEIANKNLIEESNNLRQYLYDSCEEQNTLRKYLLFEEKECSFLMAHSFQTEELNFELDFLTFMNTFFIHVAENTELNEIIVKIPPTSIENTHKEKQLQLMNLYENENIHKYLQEFKITLNKNEDTYILKQDQNPLGEMKFDNENIIFQFSKDESVLQIEGIHEIYTTTKNKIQNKDTEAKQTILDKINQTEIQTTMRENILFLGKNGGNVDTIMIGSIDHIQKKITFISIPRDLWVDGRKINSFYLKFGMEVFKEKIEKLIGQPIKYHILIDMMAFPKAIDIIEGISYTFDSPLIDPSYKTIDNEKQGTLFFPKGTYKLNGIQSLRVARSRNTSSDFARAARQQKIMKSTKEKMLTVKNPQQLLKIITLLKNNVETDVPFLDILPLYLKLRDYEVNTGYVMHTRNILISKMHETDSGKKAYILLPRDNNWELLKKFYWSAVLDE